MQALSKPNDEILLSFSKTSNIEMYIKCILQTKSYNFKKIKQETNQDDIKTF